MNPTVRASEVRPQGPWRAAWLRLRRDRASVVALVALAVILALSLFGGAVASRVLGHDGQRPFPYAVNGADLTPIGPWKHVYASTETRLDQYGDLIAPPKGDRSKTFLPLGADGPLGRDELIRLLDGGRTSLEIGLGAVLVALLVAIPLGSAAGYYGGWVDAAVSRFSETIMAFPLLLFLVFATARLGPHLNGVAYSWVVPKGVVSDALLIGAFTSFYPTRLIRAQVLTLRSAEFVDAGYMIGATDLRILRRHLLPHLVPTLLVWGAIAVATNILVEVSLSFIGVGVEPSTPTWGSALATVWGTIYNPRTTAHPAIWQTVFPTVAILITVVSLNQLSEGVRRALEPWARS